MSEANDGEQISVAVASPVPFQFGYVDYQWPVNDIAHDVWGPLDGAADYLVLPPLTEGAVGILRPGNDGLFIEMTARLDPAVIAPFTVTTIIGEFPGLEVAVVAAFQCGVAIAVDGPTSAVDWAEAVGQLFLCALEQDLVDPREVWERYFADQISESAAAAQLTFQRAQAGLRNLSSA